MMVLKIVFYLDRKKMGLLLVYDFDLLQVVIGTWWMVFVRVIFFAGLYRKIVCCDEFRPCWIFWPPHLTVQV